MKDKQKSSSNPHRQKNILNSQVFSFIKIMQKKSIKCNSVTHGEHKVPLCYFMCTYKSEAYRPIRLKTAGTHNS